MAGHEILRSSLRTRRAAWAYREQTTAANVPVNPKLGLPPILSIPSYIREDCSETCVLAEDLLEGNHEWLEPLALHRRDRGVPKQPLTKKRVGALFRGVCLEAAVEARTLTGSTKEREKRLGKGAK